MLHTAGDLHFKVKFMGIHYVHFNDCRIPWISGQLVSWIKVLCCKAVAIVMDGWQIVSYWQ